ncbi:Gamma-interferon-inducible lysosomal thiol reductase [Folsomia candida]|uniref:Gamma-interferon-inducible lysosomal thiol reductase n=1 Tax=Folsomia candida TaxID=158441 RepID=A0A226E0I0_FOLCA|nr:Gamma-interferon-inducible lysosomal thiol reductase [Folsomia candida]
MKLETVLGAVALLSACVVGQAEVNEEKLKVSVYYESLCPDSKRFIRTQLYPVKRSSLGDKFVVELIPYGKATTTPTSTSYEFSCQHGENECNGNKMHACALKYINSTQVQLDFVHCSMSTRNPPQSLTECAAKLDIVDPVEEIRTCAEGAEGSELLARNGVETHALRPKLYFVPWITYNGVFSEENLQNSQDSFKTVVCSELKKNGVSASECDATEEKWGARRA